MQVNQVKLVGKKKAILMGHYENKGEKQLNIRRGTMKEEGATPTERERGRGTEQ